MISDKDIWRAANIMIKRYGQTADIEACKRADEFSAKSDRAGMRTWLRIVAAIDFLQEETPTNGTESGGVMSKYDPLRDHLRTQRVTSIVMTLGEIEQSLGTPLPASARQYAEWWSNKDVRTTTHVQCRSWQAAGFMAFPDLAAETVTFRKS